MRAEMAIRVLAGALTLIGLALGYGVHQGWFLLTAFVGVNLIQSAFTGFCPAEMVFRKLGMT